MRRTQVAAIAALLLVASLAACTEDTEDADREGGDEDVFTEEEVLEEDAFTEEEFVDEGEGDAEEGGTVPTGFGLEVEPAEHASWTYLVYSLSDTDLEPFMLADIAEAASVGSGAGVNIVALVDRAAEHTDEDLLNLGDFDSAKLVYVDPEELFELADLGEVDLADPNTLAQFVSYGMNAFPADRYAVTISDHGGGWTGIGPDESSEEVLDLNEIAAGLETGLADAGVERIDLLGFDACLMATYEVASTLAAYADYMVASEEVEPGHGWDYRMLASLVEDPAMDPVTLGQLTIEGFQSHAEENGREAEITLSLMDLANMPALDEAMAAFAGVLTENVDALGAVIGQQRANNVEYGRSPNPAASTQLTDLGNFVSEIGVQSLQVSDQADAVLRALGDVVLAQTVGPARLGSSGLSIYFPPVLEVSDGAYGEVPVAQPWVQFLLAYYQSGQAIPPEGQPAIAGEGRSAGTATEAEAPQELGDTSDTGSVVFGDATVEQVEGGVNVSVALEPSSLPNIAEASLSFGYIDPEDGAIVQLGDTQATVGEDGVVSGFTDLTVLTLTDVDGDSVDAYLGLEFTDDGSLAYASVPLDYTEVGAEESSPVDLSIVVDAETGDVLQEIYYLIDEEAGSYGELVANPEALISPVVLVYLPDGTSEWQSYGDQALFADLPNLQYGFEPLDPGTEIYVDLTVTDFGGNQLIASGTFISE